MEARRQHDVVSRATEIEVSERLRSATHRSAAQEPGGWSCPAATRPALGPLPVRPAPASELCAPSPGQPATDRIFNAELRRLLGTRGHDAGCDRRLPSVSVSDGGLPAA